MMDDGGPGRDYSRFLPAPGTTVVVGYWTPCHFWLGRRFRRLHNGLHRVRILRYPRGGKSLRYIDLTEDGTSRLLRDIGDID